MNLAMNMRDWNQRMHMWEHNFILSSERLVHKEAFWVAIMIAIAIAALILLTALAWNSNWPPAQHYPSPFYPYMTY